ncbi:uncharacterized protein LOC144446046 [Glandiceps talaboti]
MAGNYSSSEDGACGGRKSNCLSDADNQPATNRDGIDECEACLRGDCVAMHSPQTNHYCVHFPRGSEWNFQHMTRLRLKDLNFIKALSLTCHQRIIYKWLSCTTADFTEIIRYYKRERRVSAADVNEIILSKGLFEIAAISSHSTVSKGILSEIKTEDDFLHLVRELIDRHSNTEDEEEQSLIDDHQTLLNDITALTEPLKTRVVYLNALLTWIEVCQSYRQTSLSPVLLDDLLVNLVLCAADTVGCPIRVKVREGTTRQMTVCGKEVDVQSDIEVSAFLKSVIQVLTFTENMAIEDANHILPQLACMALAAASDSPFGNDDYKTVYQIAVYSSKFPRNRETEVTIVLARCHIARSTLCAMGECPIENPLKPSISIQDCIHCNSICSVTTITTLYRVFKAVLVLFYRDLQQRRK